MLCVQYGTIEFSPPLYKCNVVEVVKILLAHPVHCLQKDFTRTSLHDVKLPLAQGVREGEGAGANSHTYKIEIFG